MNAILHLLALLVVGYLGNQFLFDRLRRRFHVVAGIEFLIIGVLAGPNVSNLVSTEDLRLMEPAIAVAIGALGLVAGLGFRLDNLLSDHGEAVQFSFFTTLLAAISVAGLIAVTLWGFRLGSLIELLPALLVLGALAAASSPSMVASVRGRLRGGGKLGDVLERAASQNRLLAICMFGLVLCAFRTSEGLFARPLTPIEWMVANLGLGITLGILFFLFLGRDRDPQQLLLACLGICLFASGAAYYLGLSPIFTNMIVGLFVANTSAAGQMLQSFIKSIGGPLVFVVLAVAGASWNINALRSPVALVFIAVLLLARPLAFRTGGYLAYRYGEVWAWLTPNMGRGLAAHGGLVIAMAVEFQRTHSGLGADAVMSATVISVLFFELVSPPRIRAVLLDAEPMLGSDENAHSVEVVEVQT